MKIAWEFTKLITPLCVDDNGAFLARQHALKLEKLIKVENKFYMLES